LTGCVSAPQPPRNRCRRNCATKPQPSLQLRRNRLETVARTRPQPPQLSPYRGTVRLRGRRMGFGCGLSFFRNPMTGASALPNRVALGRRLVTMPAALVERMARHAAGALALLPGINAAIEASEAAAAAPAHMVATWRAVVVGHDGRETRLTLYTEAGTVAAVTLDPVSAVGLAERTDRGGAAEVDPRTARPSRLFSNAPNNESAKWEAAFDRTRQTIEPKPHGRRARAAGRCRGPGDASRPVDKCYHFEC